MLANWTTILNNLVSHALLEVPTCCDCMSSARKLDMVCSLASQKAPLRIKGSSVALPFSAKNMISFDLWRCFFLSTVIVHGHIFWLNSQWSLRIYQVNLRSVEPLLGTVWHWIQPVLLPSWPPERCIVLARLDDEVVHPAGTLRKVWVWPKW